MSKNVNLSAENGATSRNETGRREAARMEKFFVEISRNEFMLPSISQSRLRHLLEIRLCRPRQSVTFESNKEFNYIQGLSSKRAQLIARVDFQKLLIVNSR